MSSDDGSIILFQRVRGRLDRKLLRQFAAILREEVTAGRPFCCLLADDRELRRLNRDFLGKNCATDVLSFPGQIGMGESLGAGPLGDVAISVERAKEQAAEFGHSTEDEIRILMLHGVLHLLGMDHKTDRGRMARTERRWRRKLGLRAGLIDRAEQ